MRWATLILTILILLLQYPLWFGKGGWYRVWDMDRQLTAQRDVNQKLEQRNAALDAEVRDLKSGYDAIEERARSELGMVKQDEVFFQLRQRPGEGRNEPSTAAMPPQGGSTSLPIRPASRPAEKR